MAEATRYGNIIVSTTDGDSVTGPLRVIGLKVVNGANAQTVSLKDASGNIIWSEVIGANVSGAMNQLPHGLQLRSQVYSVAHGSTGATVYIYLA